MGPNTSCLFAQELKLGVFDVQRILRESKSINGYRQAFLKEIEPKRKYLTDKEGYVKALEEKIKQDGKLLAPVDRKVLDEKFAAEIKELRRMKEDFEAEFTRMDREMVQKSFIEIDGVIKKIAVDEGYTLILEKTAAGVAYLKETVDITDKIINRLK